MLQSLAFVAFTALALVVRSPCQKDASRPSDTRRAGSTAKVSCMGKASTADGKPWADALVYFESPLAPESDALCTSDPVCAFTDARGRFRASLIAGRRYLVYARSDEGRTPSIQITPLTDFRASKRLLELRAQNRSITALRLRTLGLERFEKDWKEEGPLQVRIQTADGILRKFRLKEGEDQALPVLPGEKAELQILTGRGAILYRHAFPLRAEDRVDRVEDLQARKEQQDLEGSRFVAHLPKGSTISGRDLEILVLPTSLHLALEVVTKEGKGIAGAEVLHYSPSRFAGKPRRFETDEDGKLRVKVPHELFPWGQYRQPSHFDFLVRAPEREHSLAHFEFRLRPSHLQIPFARLFTKATPSVRCVLARGLRYKGRLLVPQGVDPRSIRLRGWSSGPLSRSDDWVAFVRKPSEILKVDQEGRFELGGLGSDPESIRIDVLLPREIRRALGSNEESHVPTQEGLSLRVDRIRNLEADYEAPAVDLDALVYREIEIRDPQQQPASYAIQDLQTYPNQTFRLSGKPYRARTIIQGDRRGRCRLLLPRGPFRLLIVTETAYELVDWKGQEPPRSPWRITLRPKPVLRGRILDKQGRGIAFAWIQPVKLVGIPELEGLRLDHEGVRVASLQEDEFRCDSEGRFEIRYIPLYRRAWTLSATARPPGPKVPDIRFRIPPKDEGKDLRLVLDRKQ